MSSEPTNPVTQEASWLGDTGVLGRSMENSSHMYLFNTMLVEHGFKDGCTRDSDVGKGENNSVCRKFTSDYQK